MTFFGNGAGGILDSRSSPVLSPNKWNINGRHTGRYGASDIGGVNDPSWAPSRRKYVDDSRYQNDFFPSLNGRVDMLGRTSDAAHSSTPEMRALRHRIMDSPSHSGALDVPAYLRSVESKRQTHTPKRSTNRALSYSRPRKDRGYLNDDLGFKLRSPLLSWRSKNLRRSRGELPELKIGSYTPLTRERYNDSNSLFTDHKYDGSETYKISPVKNRINIHATDDILNRIKRGLSECENISKRLDRQYGERRLQAPPEEYSERVFPRVLADNLFSSKNNYGTSYQRKLNTKGSNLMTTTVDTYNHGDAGEKEQPKSTLARILENIKRIRKRALFSDSDDSTGKRKYVEIERDAITSPKRVLKRSIDVDVDAIQQRIKQQRRNLLSQNSKY